MGRIYIVMKINPVVEFTTVVFPPSTSQPPTPLVTPHPPPPPPAPAPPVLPSLWPLLWGGEAGKVREKGHGARRCASVCSHGSQVLILNAQSTAKEKVVVVSARKRSRQIHKQESDSLFVHITRSFYVVFGKINLNELRRQKLQTGWIPRKAMYILLCLSHTSGWNEKFSAGDALTFATSVSERGTIVASLRHPLEAWLDTKWHGLEEWWLTAYLSWSRLYRVSRGKHTL